MFDRENAVALITGSGHGIGEATAHRLARDGVKIGVVDIERDDAERVASDIRANGGQAISVACDVGKREEVECSIAEIEQTFGVIDVLVNNAGVGGPFHRVDEVSDEEWAWIFDTNVKSVFMYCRNLLPKMREAGGGRIINIASTHGLYGHPGSSTYSATKHAVIGYTKSIAIEWGEYGITCNAICPGSVNTKMGFDALSDETIQAILHRTPAGRIHCEPEEIAELVAYLTHPLSSYVTGTSIVIDGGFTSHVKV